MVALHVYLSVGWIIALVVVGVVILGIVIFILVKNHIEKTRQRLVRENSSAIRELKEINKRYKFIDYVSSSEYTHKLSSRQRFYGFDHSGYVNQIVRFDLDKYIELFKKFDEEDKLYKQYLDEVRSVKLGREEDMDKLKIPAQIYKAYESIEFKKLKKHKLYNRCEITVNYEYTSKGGRNCYFNSVTYKEAQLRHMVEKSIKSRDEHLERQFGKQTSSKKKINKQDNKPKSSSSRIKKPSEQSKAYDINLDDYELDENALVSE